jgi:hypothetical protein
MERHKIISRRGFLGTMLSAGCITGINLPQTKSDHPGSPFLPELISTLNDQSARHRYVLSGEQIKNWWASDRKRPKKICIPYIEAL